MKKIIPIFLIILIYSNMLHAQATGNVDYKYLGISFTIPDGWIGQEMGEGYLIGSNTEPGFAFLSTHQERSVAGLQNQARMGIQDQNGTYLTLQGQLQPFGNNGVGGDFGGTLEWQQVKAYIIGLVNPQGNGVTVMVAAAPNQYSQNHQQLAQKIAESIRFYQAEESPVVQQWKQALANAKLTYSDSYYSSGLSTNDGYSTGGGFSSKTEIHLCGQGNGHFLYRSSSSVSMDTGGAFGNSSGGSNGDGSWEIASDGHGNALLKLHFNNGDEHEYELSYQNNSTYLNGKKYYRTGGAECY